MLFRRNFKKFIVFIFTIAMTISFANVKAVIAQTKHVSYFGTVYNVVTYIGEKPDMPPTVQVYWTDGTKSVEPVIWDISNVNLDYTGETTVTGKLKNYPTEDRVKTDVIVKEDYFYEYYSKPGNMTFYFGEVLKPLPTTVMVKWRSGKVTNEKITWDTSNGELRRHGDHSVTGSIRLTSSKIYVQYKVYGNRDLWDYDEDLDAYVYSDKYGNSVTDTWKYINGKWYYFYDNGAMAANEWIDGYWLNKDGSWTYKAKGSWHKNKRGWWFGDTSGWYAKKEWLKINGNWYCFNKDGYMLTSQYINGYHLDSTGKMIGTRYSWTDGFFGRWEYRDEDYRKIANEWVKIDNEYYYFDGDGYMAHDEWINGYWLSSDGVWRYKPRGYWVKVGKYSWKYKDKSGWQAKNATIKIDGDKYDFDNKGITKIYS